MKLNPKTKKILYVFIAILPIAIIGMFGKTQKKSFTNSNITTPIVKNDNIFTYKPNTNLVIKNQNTKLDISMASINIKKEPQKIYKVTNPLITENHINSLVSNLNLYDIDRIGGTPDGDFLWINKSGSLFISINQNQIIYTKKYNKQTLSNATLNNDDIKNASVKYIQNLLGDNVLKTININPKINFLYIDPKSIEEEPKNTEFDKANLISVSFNQELNNFPVVTDSPNTEIIRITMNKDRELVDLRVYGGFLSVKEDRNTDIPILENIDTTKLHRITYTKDISSEKLFSDTKTLSIVAEEISLAYYYQNNGFLAPVIFIKGKMTTGKYSETATFIHPISTTPAP